MSFSEGFWVMQGWTGVVGLACGVLHNSTYPRFLSFSGLALHGMGWDGIMLAFSGLSGIFVRRIMAGFDYCDDMEGEWKGRGKYITKVDQLIR